MLILFPSVVIVSCVVDFPILIELEKLFKLYCYSYHPWYEQAFMLMEILHGFTFVTFIVAIYKKTEILAFKTL